MAEITTTQSFSDGDTVTATKLNNIQGNASIQPEAITNRTAETTIDQANDLLLMYDASATSLKKITPSNLIKAGTASDFPVTGNATIGGTLGVTGASTLTGNATIGGNLSVTGNSVVKAGTAASPAIQPTGDTNTGIFFPAADTIAFSEGGAESMRINSSGQVGIGIDEPNAKLFVRAGSSPNTAQLLVGYLDGSENYYDANTHYFRNGSASEVMRINSGKVGIGTTSADSIFHIKDSVAVLTIEGTATSSASVQFKTNTINRYKIATPDSSADLAFYSSGTTERLRIDSNGNVGIGGTPSTLLHIQATSPSLRIQAASGNSSAIDFYRTASLNSGQIASESTNALVFSTNTGSALVERLRIDSSGNVGIGTASPIRKLSVEGGGIGFQDAGGSTSRAISWIDSTTSIAPLQILGNSVSGNCNLSFLTNAFGSAATERMRIDSSGNVGIGITAPNARLFVRAGESPNSAQLLVGYLNGSENYYDANTHYFRNGSAGEVMRINAGNLLVGKTSLSTSTIGFQFDLANQKIASGANGGATAFFNRNGDNGTVVQIARDGAEKGGISVTTTAVAYNTTSDYRLKTNLEPISSGINRIKQLPVYRFNWIADESGNKVDGFVAHEAQAIVPECVTGEKDAVDSDGNPIYQGIDQSKIVPLLTAALKEAIVEIEILKSKVATLEAV